MSRLIRVFSFSLPRAQRPICLFCHAAAHLYYIHRSRKFSEGGPASDQGGSDKVLPFQNPYSGKLKRGLDPLSTTLDLSMYYVHFFNSIYIVGKTSKTTRQQDSDYGTKTLPFILISPNKGIIPPHLIFHIFQKANI